MKKNIQSIIPFICVNYGTYEETIKYIENVIGLQNSEKALIIVVDNSPNTLDIEKLNEFKNKYSLSDSTLIILREENKGYFQGLNVGIRYANQLNIECKYYVVGNNDILFKKDFINQIVNYDLDQKTFVICPDVITTEGSHENPHVLYPIGFIRKLKYDIYYSSFYIARILRRIKSTERRFKKYDPNKKYIHMGIGALYILTPNFFTFFENLWEDVFLYGEEAILAGQLKSVGGKMIYDPTFVCNHNESSTTSKMETYSKYKIIQQSYRVYKKYL